MKNLENLFSPEKKTALALAAQDRVSCRAYASPPDAAQFGSLCYLAGRYALPGARLSLENVEESLFTGTILGMGRITGCTMAAVVIASDSEPLGRIRAGILGEAFVLEATAMGLGTCWVGGTYRARQLNTPLSKGETVLAVIAVGVPAGNMKSPRERKRKPLDRITRGQRLSGEAARAAELVQIAPSALNQQPWQMTLTEQGRFILDVGERTPLDGGIALCHAELGLTSPHVWEFARNRLDPMAWTELPL